MIKKKKELKKKLFKLYEKYSQEIKQQSQLDKSNLENSFNLAELISDWIQKKLQLIRLKTELEKERNRIFKDLYEYYKMDYEIELKRGEINDLIKSDKEIIEIDELLSLTKEVMNLIDTSIEILKLKHWERRDYLEYLKFINGIT